MRIEMLNCALEHDRDYGADRRTGWSVVIAGSYAAELERYLIVALWKGLVQMWRNLTEFYKWK